MRLSQFNPSPGWLTPLNDSPCFSLDFSPSLFHHRNSPSAYNMRERRKIQLVRTDDRFGCNLHPNGVPNYRHFRRFTGNYPWNYWWISRSSVSVRKNSITNLDTMEHTSLTLTLKRNNSTYFNTRLFLYFRAIHESRAQSRNRLLLLINKQYFRGA